MMKSEFIERVGFEPTGAEYADIEAEYMGTDVDKDQFCKEWKKNGGVQRQMRLRAIRIEELEHKLTMAEKQYEEMEDFIKLSLEVLPLANKLQEVLKKNGVQDLASITLSHDGYIAFHTHETKWEMVRVRNGKPVRIKYEISDEIEISEGEKGAVR